MKRILKTLALAAGQILGRLIYSGPR